MAKKTNGQHAEPVDDDAEQKAVELAAETLTGDLRDFILDRLRHEQAKKPWNERSEGEQRETIREVERAMRYAAKQAVEIIAARGMKTIRATLEQVTVKEGIKATLMLSKFDAQRHSLIDATGAAVMVVVADVEDFVGEKAPAEIKPDAPELALAVHSAADGAGEPLN